jgi:hypothetical protein
MRLNRGIANLVILAMIIFFLAGCAPASHSPVITSLKVKREIVPPSGSCQIECIVSDKNGDELSYAWFASSGSIDGSGPMVNWTAPKTPGTYAIAVTVSDGNGQDTRGIILTVRVNHPPTIISLVANTDWVSPSGSCQVECQAEDPDGDSLSYNWSTNGGKISGTGPTATWTAPEIVSIYNITVTVTDALGGEDTSSLDISVALSPPPIIESLIVTPKEPQYLKEYQGGYRILKDRSCEIKCVASDPEGDVQLSYKWSANGITISEEGSVITWTAPSTAPPQGGKVTITVAVSDSSGSAATKSIVFKVETCAACAFR